MRGWIALVFAVPLLWPAVAVGQSATSTSAAAVTSSTTPGNPTNPGDTINNPHPTMPWFGIPTPYGQFVRWVWMPPQPVVTSEQVLYEPGFWAAQTTAGYYYPVRWGLREVVPGTFGWVLLSGGAVPFAR